MLFDDRNSGEDFEEVTFVQDRASGLRAILAIHSTALGPAAGGIRRLSYPDGKEALADALRLAEGMSLKNAFAEVPAGGGKMVVLDHAQIDRDAAYRDIGRFVAGLGGRWLCGPDVGTGASELDHVRRAAPDFTNPIDNDAGFSTALGVWSAMKGAARARDGSPSLEGKHVVVQGLGSVGLALTRLLIESGARVSACDPVPEAQANGAAAGATIVPIDEAWTLPCDMFSPCALGGILTPETVTSLRASIVCGSANNQLASPETGRLLADAGVLYVPDFAANVGAVTEGVFAMTRGNTAQVRQEAHAHIRATEQRVVHLFERVDAEGTLPHETALSIARARLGGARGRPNDAETVEANAAAR